MRICGGRQPHHLEAVLRVCEAFRLMGRIAVGDKDHAIEPEPSSRLFRNEKVGIVNWIEGPAENADFGFWILDFGLTSLRILRFEL